MLYQLSYEADGKAVKKVKYLNMLVITTVNANSYDRVKIRFGRMCIYV